MFNQPRRNLTFYRARHLRKKMTHAERVLWRSLRKGYLAPYKFRRQVGISKYIVDFLEKHLLDIYDTCVALSAKY